MSAAFKEVSCGVIANFVGESHGANSCQLNAALPSIRLSDLSSIGTSSLDDVKEMQNKLTS